MTSAIGGIIGGIGSIIGGSTAASGATQAAQIQAQAQQQAIQAELQMQQNAIAQEQQGFNEAQTFQAPIYDTGLGNLYELSAELRTPGTSGVGSIPLGGTPSLTDASQLPGYSFTLDQGLKATQNAAAAQGLGASGPALKGAATYAEGLAGTYYNNYLQNYWTNQNNRFNMLYNLAGFGSGSANALTSAAVGAGNTGAQASTAAGGQMGTSIASGAAGQSQAIQNAANLTGAGLVGAGSSFGNALQTAALLGGGGSTLTQPTGYSGLNQSQIDQVNSQGFYYGPGATTGTG